MDLLEKGFTLSHIGNLVLNHNTPEGRDREDDPDDYLSPVKHYYVENKYGDLNLDITVIGEAEHWKLLWLQDEELEQVLNFLEIIRGNND